MLRARGATVCGCERCGNVGVRRCEARRLELGAWCVGEAGGAVGERKLCVLGVGGGWLVEWVRERATSVSVRVGCVGTFDGCVSRLEWLVLWYGKEVEMGDFVAWEPA
ncbi:unnamed protein product [Dovyalis caffra]|uniref:Uncharacterized protein n=1 Tax=Dovyalis caffra TaxID=77055 RepID=A0AAV1R0J4_9ROSI|nr:unnamed protein product [Dovyalis caffra]